MIGFLWAVILAAAPVTVAMGQGHDGHMMPHAEHGGNAAVWRMPPMDMSMPMLPGLENALPPVGPFLPAAGVEIAQILEARPGEQVELNDGDTLDVVVSLVRRHIAGHDMIMYGYNGQYPGPLIKASRGSTIYVNVENRIVLPTTVHWHGVRLDNAFDGVPGVTQAPIETGMTFLYEIKVRDSGIYWYHPHMREDIQQDLGLYGNLLVVDPDPGHFGPANREEVLILDDLLVDNAGPLPWGDEAPTHALMGRFGNVMLVNGRTNYEIQVDRGEVVRYYLTNVANTRTFNLAFGNARAKIVASDVSRFEKEEWVRNVPIAPAERYVVDVIYDELGEFATTNSVQAINHFRGTFYSSVDTLWTVRVSAQPAATSYGDTFDVLRSFEEVTADIRTFADHFARPPDHTLELTVKVEDLPLPIVLAMEIDTLYVPPMEWNDAMPMMNWLSTGKQVTWILRDTDTGKENDGIEWTFEQGDVAKIRIFNNPRSFHPMQHPIHIHGQRYLVLSIDGVATKNRVWKDTAIVPVGSTVDLLVDMSNPGEWMLHCHIAEHLHSGMMFGFTVRPGELDADRASFWN